MKNAMWIHGGPGFNSFHEKATLDDLLQSNELSVEFWNEPSKNRPSGDPSKENDEFGSWKNSLEQAFLRLHLKSPNQKIALIAHSFGAHGAIHLLERYEFAIDRVIFITPSLNLGTGLRAIAKIAAENFEFTDLKKSQEIFDLLQKATGHYDQNLKKALEIALGDATLLSRYWINKEEMMNWLQSYSKSESALDLDSFWNVLGSMDFHHLIQKNMFSTPCTVIFGEHDPVSNKVNEMPLVETLFNDSTVSEMKGVAHYPHLEKPNEFIESFLKQKEPSTLTSFTKRNQISDHSIETANL